MAKPKAVRRVALDGASARVVAAADLQPRGGSVAVMSKATSPIQSRGVLPSVNAACLLLVGIEAAAAAHVRKNIRLEEWD